MIGNVLAFLAGAGLGGALMLLIGGSAGLAAVLGVLASTVIVFLSLLSGFRLH